jgi:hypothetical protein
MMRFGTSPGTIPMSDRTFADRVQQGVWDFWEGMALVFSAIVVALWVAVQLAAPTLVVLWIVKFLSGQ